ncbi:MAG: hypothetical protein J5679_00770 [Alphaproteobacteria bacterium]|nr:hypothetical protein [Alphaproteobacteria bacterium]
MKNVHVRDFLQKLSGEKLYADWTDVDNTKQNPMHYGIYDVRNSPVGPFMINYVSRECKNDDVLRETITLRVPGMDIDELFWGPFWPEDKPDPDFITLCNFISGLKSRPSMLSYHEAFDKFDYCMTFPYVRDKAAQKFVCARAIYDVINTMIVMGRQNTICAPLKHGVPGYSVTVRFPDNKSETVNFADFRSEFGKPADGFVIAMPSINLEERFVSSWNSYKDKMVYNHAKQYLDALKSNKPLVLGTEEFCRFDAPYRQLMRRILNARQTGKSK